MQPCDSAHESARTTAVNGMQVAHRRLGRHTPAYAPGGDSGGGCRDNCREPGRRGDGALLTINGAVGIGSVGTYIVGG